MDILLPTDFSSCATIAFDLACNMARKTQSHLHLYHCADVPDDWEDLTLDQKVRDNPNKYIVLDIKAKLQVLKSLALDQGISATIHYTGGTFINNLSEILDTIDIDLTIMGAHGHTGSQDLFIGSNTQKAIRKYKCNFLVINKPVPDFHPKSAVFVSSLNEDDQVAFRSFLNYATAWHITDVHVLTIDTSSWFTQPAIVIREAQKDFKLIAEDFNCDTHFYSDYSIQEGIRHFLEDNDIDLVSISYRERHPIKRIFMGSNVETLINHTDIPVLCINK